MERFTRHDHERALPHFYRAAQLDSAFVTPAIAAAVAHWNLGQYESADSLVREVSDGRERLLPLDGYFLDFVAACLRGDYAAAHEASLGALTISPGGGWWEYQAAWTALAAGQPNVALEHLDRMDPAQASLRDWPEVWTTLAQAYHAIGEYREELRVAIRGGELFPELKSLLDNEIRARAALGRVEEVTSLLAGAVALPDEEGWSDWDLITNAALEFRSHGHEDAYRAAIRRAFDWLDSRPDDEKAQPEHQSRMGRTLYWDERWEEAWVLSADLGPETPVPVSRFGMLGTTNARVRNQAAAQRIGSLLAAIDRSYTFGEPELWRARIAALLGRRDDAAELLADAFRNGLPYSVSLHRDFDLGNIRTIEQSNNRTSER
jgi:tetratricopeptide (TPR) repeat protein